MAQRSETETKQQILDVFKQHFILSDEDLTILTSSAEPVNDKFFSLLARVNQIHKDCEILLGSENQRLGLELMEQTTRNLGCRVQEALRLDSTGVQGFGSRRPSYQWIDPTSSKGPVGAADHVSELS